MTSGENIYILEPIDILKGNPQNTFILSVSNALPGNTDALGKHEDISFWVNAKAGSHLDSDCKIRPNLRIGHKYIVFYSNKPSLRDVEQITSEDDKLLKYVKQYLSKKGAQPILKPEELASQLNSVHLYECPSRDQMRRGMPRLVESLKGSPPDKAPWPNMKGIKCGGTGQRFLYLEADKQIAPITVPVNNDIIEFSNLSEGIEIIEKNKLSIDKFRDLVKND